MGIVLIDFVRKPVDIMYPHHQRMLDLSLYNSILSKPFALYCKGEIPAKVALCIEVKYSSKLYHIPFASRARQGAKGRPSLGRACGDPTHTLFPGVGRGRNAVSKTRTRR
jgi:hypothetical protein